jgi:hypothetical protein
MNRSAVPQDLNPKTNVAEDSKGDTVHLAGVKRDQPEIGIVKETIQFSYVIM